MAKDAPASAEQLRSQVEAALRAKDTNGFEALVNGQGLSESMKAEMNNECADVLGHDIASVKLAPLPANVQLTNELRGVLYEPNVTVVGEIVVEYSEKGNSVRLPYGTKGSTFYLSGTVEEKIGAPATKEKSLNVSVMGSAMPDAGAFAGSYVYVKGGKEITAGINGRGNRSEAFWGDYIKSCTVRKTADNPDWIKLRISEDGKKVFESGKTTNKDPIVYERK